MSCRCLLIASLAVLAGGCAQAEPEAAMASPPTAAHSAAHTAAEPPTAPLPELRVSTAWVADLLLTDDALWVASDGGVERYTAPDYRKRRLYTVADGLDTQQVVRLTVNGGVVVAYTAAGRCTLRGERFRCTRPRAGTARRAVLRPEQQPVLGNHHGARVTRRYPTPAGTFVGTAGAGVWWLTDDGQRRLTPREQLCGNHLTSFAVHRGALWVGTFNHGVCKSADGRHFEAVEAPFRMVNDLLATPAGLLVAASEGLFRLSQSGSFERVVQVAEPGANGLAMTREQVLVTTPGALWRLPLHERAAFGAGAVVTRSPGGSGALQGVAVSASGGHTWLASEDRGAIHVDGESCRVFDRTAGLPSSWMLDVAAADDGSAYLATLRDGVLRLWPDGRWSAVAGAPDPWIFAVSIDERGLWIGSQQGGAVVVAGESHPLSMLLPLLPDGRVHAFGRFAGRKLVGTQHGLAMLPAGS